MNILLIVAHYDDEVLGCGGTIRKLANEGHNIYTCVLCTLGDAQYNRPELDDFNADSLKAEKIIGIKDSIRYTFGNIQLNTVPHLELVKAIETAIKKFRPEWVFTHFGSDLNIDHRICYEATMAAIRLPERQSEDLCPTMIKKILLFEVYSSTDWNCSLEKAFRPNCYFDIKNTFSDKMKALYCYANAIKPVPHPRSEEKIKAMAIVRGSEIGLEMAEAFCLVRDLNL